MRYEETHGITKKWHQCKNSAFLYTQTITKSAPPGVAVQKGGKQLSLEARIDAVVTLAWMADGMDLLTGAIKKLSKPVLFWNCPSKNWPQMKADETPS